MRRTPIASFTYALLGFALVAAASVTRDNPLIGSPTSAFAAVGLFGNVGGYYGSATAIHDGRWVLTARHNVTTDGTITGSLQPPSELRFKVGPETLGADLLIAGFDADIALVRLLEPSQEFVGLWAPSLGNELSQTFTAVGYGGTDANGDGNWGPGGFGTRRLFENRIDAVQSGSLSGQGTMLRYDFDKVGSDFTSGLEGISGPGDSGGAAFLSASGSYLLAGVISSSGSPTNGATGSVVRIADYHSMIMSIVPEPGTLAIAMLIAPLFLRRRVQRVEL